MGIQPEKTHQELFNDACENNSIETVKFYLSNNNVNPAYGDNISFKMACSKGHIKVVMLLLTDGRVDPSVNNNTPIILASQEGHLEIVELLLHDPVLVQNGTIDSTAQNNCALRSAIYNDKPEVVKCLLQDKHVVKHLRETVILSDCEAIDKLIRNHKNKRDPRIISLIFSSYQLPIEEEDGEESDETRQLRELIRRKKQENCERYMAEVKKKIEDIYEDTIDLESLSESHLDHAIDKLAPVCKCMSDKSADSHKYSVSVKLY